MSHFKTHALWGNTNVVQTLHPCSRETRALPSFTPQTSLPLLNRLSNAVQLFQCHLVSLLLFQAACGTSNTHKTQGSAALGKTSITHVEKSQQRASPMPPNLCSGCIHFTLATCPIHHIKETCPDKAQVTILGGKMGTQYWS